MIVLPEIRDTCFVNHRRTAAAIKIPYSNFLFRYCGHTGLILQECYSISQDFRIGLLIIYVEEKHMVPGFAEGNSGFICGNTKCHHRTLIRNAVYLQPIFFTVSQLETFIHIL